MPPRNAPCLPTDLKKPTYPQKSLSYILHTLTYANFVSDTDSLNTKPIDRPLMEESWMKLVKEKTVAGEMSAVEIRGVFDQVKGDKKFDVEKYWTSKKFKALFDHSVDLNIKPVGERKEMGTAEGYAKEYQGVIGAHPEESLRSRR